MSKCKFLNPRFVIGARMKQPGLRPRKPRKWLVYRACKSYSLALVQACRALWQCDVGKVNFLCRATLWLFIMFCLTCSKVRFTISPDSLELHSQRLMDLADRCITYICSWETSVSQLTKKASPDCITHGRCTICCICYRRTQYKRRKLLLSIHPHSFLINLFMFSLTWIIVKGKSSFVLWSVWNV